jgi:hypothetical protein
MHIYIDESGSFVMPQSSAPSVSTMGALVVPECYQEAIWKRYKRMRAQWPKKNGEVKGRLLDEAQVAALVGMLVQTPVLYDVIAIDLGMQTNDAIIRHRDGQALKLSQSVGPEHKETLIAEIKSLRDRLLATSPQLYVQTVLMFELVWKSLQHSTLLYSQRLPTELGAIKWIFDAKDRTKRTDWEDWWKTVIAPMLQSKGLRDPLISLIGGDYSHFERSFQIETSQWFRSATGIDEKYGASLGRVFKNVSFESNVDYGLEMVDVLTNAIRRALNGRLEETGWRDISKLIPKLKKQQRVQLVSFKEEPIGYDMPYASVIRKLDRFYRHLLTE